jgi:hypothetical protein
MPMIMVNCLKTGRAVPTGMATDQPSWRRLSADWAGEPFLCPACGAVHAWIKSDAFLRWPSVVTHEHRR